MAVMQVADGESVSTVPCRAQELERRTVRTSPDLTQEALEIVLLQPLRGVLQTLSTDCRGDTGGACSGAVAVEVLVHLFPANASEQCTNGPRGPRSPMATLLSGSLMFWKAAPLPLETQAKRKGQH